MSKHEFPRGWDNDRAKRLAEHYESLSEAEQVAEDEAAAQERAGHVIIEVPEELLPAIRQLLAGHSTD